MNFATIDAHGYDSYIHLHSFWLSVFGSVLDMLVLCRIHIGVGSKVARSTVMGNLRASVRGTSNGKYSHVFLFQFALLLCSALGS